MSENKTAASLHLARQRVSPILSSLERRSNRLHCSPTMPTQYYSSGNTYITRKTVNICMDISGRVSASPGPEIIDKIPAAVAQPSPPPQPPSPPLRRQLSPPPPARPPPPVYQPPVYQPPVYQPPRKTPPRNYDFVEDAMYALEKDCAQTANILRAKVPKPKPAPKPMEVEYRLRLTPKPENFVQDNVASPFDASKKVDDLGDPTLEKAYGVPVENDLGLQRRRPPSRSRSQTPASRRMIHIEKTPEPGQNPFCTACGREIDGRCVTALAPSSQLPQKFHAQCFVCTYCTRPLNTRGTYKEHDRKPYCHECFYRLYSGLIYAFDEHDRAL